MPDAYNNLNPLPNVSEHRGAGPVSEIFTEPPGVGVPETTIAPNEALPENDETQKAPYETGGFVDTVARVPNLQPETPVEKHEPTTPVGEIPKEQPLTDSTDRTTRTADYTEAYFIEQVTSIT